MPAKHCSRDAKSPSTLTKTLASPQWSLDSHLHLYKARIHPAVDVLRIVAEASDLSDGNNCLLTLNLYHCRVLGYYQFLHPGINQFPFGISSHLFPSYTASYPLALSKVKWTIFRALPNSHSTQKRSNFNSCLIETVTYCNRRISEINSFSWWLYLFYGKLNYNTQVMLSFVAIQDAKAIFHAAGEQPFLCKVIKLFYILPRTTGIFCSRQVWKMTVLDRLSSLSEILQAAFCCYYFSPVFNNHTSPCFLPKSSPAGTQSLPTASRRKALLYVWSLFFLLPQRANAI